MHANHAIMQQARKQNPIPVGLGAQLNAHCAMIAGLMHRGELADHVGIHGHYNFQKLFPKAHQFEDFIRMRDEIAHIETRDLMTRLRMGKRLAYLQAKIKEIDQEVEAEGAFPNVVVTVGKNVMLDAALAGSGYTVVGPFIGLIGAASYTTGPAVGDTMASHGGWTEAGNANAPTYTSPRKTAAWSAASAGSKALSAAASYGITGTGTAKGAFMLYFTGAVSTIDNTSGTLFSAGLYTGGDQPVVNGNTLNVSYSVGL